MPCQLRCCEMSKAVKRLCGEGWGEKAQEDEEQLKAREGGEFTLNSFRSPLQAEDVKSNCNLPGLRVFFFFARHQEATINAFFLAVFFLAIDLKIATRRAFIVLQFCETSLFSITVCIP